MGNKTKQEAAFLDRVSPEPMSGCWLWDASVNPGGYGRMGGRDPRLAHRVSYEMFVGEIPPKKLVLQKCGVPSCVNPEHLRIGIHKDRRKPKTIKERMICNNCGQKFERAYTNGNPNRMYCGKFCNNQAWVRKNPHRRKERLRQARDTSLKTKYGITADKYDEIYQEQGGVCLICGADAAGGATSNSKLHVDHCHTTGKIRGLLCSKCNTGLGMFRDNPKLLKAAIGYLAQADTGLMARPKQK